MNKLARFQTISKEDIREDLEGNEEVSHPDDLEGIRKEAEAISTEAFGGTEMLTAAVQKVPELLSKVTGFISNKFTKNENLSASFYKPEVIRQMGKDSNYLVFSKRKVFKSVGQKVKTIELVDVLKTGYDSVIYPFVKTDLINAERAMASFASNPQELRSFRHGDIVSKSVDSSYKKTVKDLSACFDGKDTTSQEEFGKLYDRMADFETVSKNLTELNAEVYKINIDEVIGLSDRLNASFTAIIASLENPEIRETVSPAVVKLLSDTCYQLAALLEFYSVYLFKLRECTIAVKDTYDALK